MNEYMSIYDYISVYMSINNDGLYILYEFYMLFYIYTHYIHIIYTLYTHYIYIIYTY